MWIDTLLRPIRKKVFLTESKVNRNLDSYLKKARRVFDVDSLIRENQDTKKIADYYARSHRFYKLLNSPDGYIHFPFSNKYYIERDDYL